MKQVLDREVLSGCHPQRVIGNAEEPSPFREDGTTYSTYVRAYNGQNSRWYQAAMAQGASSTQ
jgi:hypothetical protein